MENTAEAKNLDAMNNSKDCIGSWLDVNAKHESTHSYSARNGNAIGKYQIMIQNWASAGYIERDAENWESAVFTDKARAAGVNSVDHILHTTDGHQLQEKMARGLLTQMYREVKSVAQNLNGKEVMTASGKKTLNDAMIMRGVWWLGSGQYKNWANNGFSGAALEQIDKVVAEEQILKLNCGKKVNGTCTSGYHELSRHQSQTWDSFVNTDLSCFNQ